MGSFCCDSSNNKKSLNPILPNQNTNDVTSLLSNNKVPGITNISNTNINTNFSTNIQINSKSEENINQDIKKVSIQEGIDFLVKGALISSFDSDNNFHYIYISGNPKLMGSPVIRDILYHLLDGQ